MNTVSRREQRIGFMEDCFQERVQGRLVTGHGSRGKRGIDGFAMEVVPKQSVSLHSSMALLSPRLSAGFGRQHAKRSNALRLRPTSSSLAFF
jgi:hypothetical protein